MKAMITGGKRSVCVSDVFKAYSAHGIRDTYGCFFLASLFQVFVSGIVVSTEHVERVSLINSSDTCHSTRASGTPNDAMARADISLWSRRRRRSCGGVHCVTLEVIRIRFK